MYAITLDSFGGPEVMEWAEVPTVQAGPGEIRIRTIAAGVNRADLLQRRGLYPPPPGASEMLGLEATGVVDQVSEGVTRWRVGDQVGCLLGGGGYAEYVVAPARQVMPLPSGIDPVTAAGLIEVSCTVLSNFDRVHLSAGETVLIHGGAGGIGSFAIQYADALGCRVLTTAGTDDKLAYCRDLGVDQAFNYHGDWAANVMMATHDRGVDVILDVVGAAYLEPNVSCLAQDGRLVVIGTQKGNRGTLDLGLLLRKCGTVTATSLRSRSADFKGKIIEEVTERVWPLFESGRITPAHETRLPMSQAARAHQLLESGENMGKILLVA